jgi:plastocyanin
MEVSRKMGAIRKSLPGRRVAAAGFAAAAVATALLLVSPPTPASSDGTATASKRATAKVRIPSLTYMPRALTVRKGTTVVWTNSSHTSHSATRRGSFDTGMIRPGKSASIRFDQKGTFSYFCTVHPFMHGKIIVR